MVFHYIAATLMVLFILTVPLQVALCWKLFECCKKGTCNPDADDDSNSMVIEMNIDGDDFEYDHVEVEA